jgi:hypothetical protein
MMGYALRGEYAWMLITILASIVVALFVSLQAGFFMIVFAAIAWWVWQYPEQGFLFLIVTIPLLPMLKITHSIDTASLVKDVIIATLFLRVFAVPLLTKTLPYRRNIVVLPALLLMCWSLLQMVRADSLILGILRWRDIMLYLLLYIAVLYLPHTKEIMKTRLRWFATSVAVVLLLGVYQWFFASDSAVLRYDPVREIWIPRLSSILAHPSIFGQYIAGAATLFAALAVYARSAKVQLASAAAFLVTLPFIYLTYSRAVWMGLTAALLLMGGVYGAYLLSRNIDKKKLSAYAMSAAVPVSAIILLLLITTPVGGFVRSIVDPTYGSNEERIEFMVRLIAPTTSGQAIVGQGLGNVTAQQFRTIDIETYDLATVSARAVQQTKDRTLVDNQYLKTFVEMGVIGLVIYGWIYFRLGKAAAVLALSAKQKTRRIIGLWAVGFLTAFIVQAFFIDIWAVFPTNAAFWIIAALVSASSVSSGQIRTEDAY